jgi:hypothetical protein
MPRGPTANCRRGLNAPKVMNGASDLLVQVFGQERGQHASSALYQHELARDAPVAGELTLGRSPALRTSAKRWRTAIGAIQ